jgi:predicted ATP-grasp superfamily ATP-dependent carboligase
MIAPLGCRSFSGSDPGARAPNEFGAEQKKDKNRVPAVVVGAAGACGLGVLRSLSRANVPVVLLDTDGSAPAMHSRYGRKMLISSLRGLPLIEELRALRSGINESPVLIMTDDDAVLTISKYRAELEGSYRFRLPSHECLAALMHKTSFQRLAEEHGFRVPRSLLVARPGDVSELTRLRFPCIIKPTRRSAKYVGGGFQRAYKVDSLAHAEVVFHRLLPVFSDFVVQEWIEGPDSNIYFCLQYRGANGETVCSFTGRKLSIWPPDVGITASCTAAPDAHSRLERLTDAFFDRTSFAGMGSIEFKKDSRSGEFLMIEPTVGRVDWQEEVAALHGVNIPLAAYLYEVGIQPARPTEVLVPVVWRDGWAHWKSSRNAPVRQHTMPGTRVYDAYWRLEDPMPALVRGLGGSMRSLQKALNRASIRLRSRPMWPGAHE